MNNKQSGGDIIGTGSFGCVFSPALKCEKQTKLKKEVISKIFFGNNSKNEATIEIKNNKIIKSIKGYKKWAYIWEKKCLPKKYDDINEIDECLDDKDISIEEFNKNRYMLQGNNMGKSLKNIISLKFNDDVFSDNKSFVNNFLYIMKLIKPLFIGLVEMNKHNIAHNDIKIDNIVIDSVTDCKYIDFGLSSKYSNIIFFKNRSMREFISDRIYPSYPYEFIYLFASNILLKEEQSDINYDIYRDLHKKYKLIHENIFKRKHTNTYLLGLIDYALNGKLIKEKKNIISLLDTYSLGVLIPNILIENAILHNKLSNLEKLILTKEIKPFIDLFKNMCEPNNYDRITPINAYQRYLELETIYLKSNKKKTIKRELKRIRR
jgi:serine/threonine protein kinase